MKRILTTTAVLAAVAALAACSKKEAAAPAAEAVAPAAATAPAAPADNMAGMDMAAAKMAKGTGTVTAVSADSVTIDHAAIPEANWPAMTMAFKASPEMAKAVKAGDKVAFDLKLEGGGGEITAITKQ